MVEPNPITTQRAYTLRLHGADKNDHSWRDALWATHDAVNKGAKVFGDWLLTLRGGLCHTLADAKVPDKPDRDPTDQERRDRRILLALSWLSVESSPKPEDPFKAFVIASGKYDCQSSRNEKVVAALRAILEKRGVHGAALDAWVRDCEPSLSAAIRDDAVWVNRSAAFDKACQRVGDSLTRQGAWDLLEPFFKSPVAYLAPLETAEELQAEGTPEDKAKDLVQKAGMWLSNRFGTGTGADFSLMSKVYDAMAAWGQGTRTFSTGAEALASLAQSLEVFRPPSNDAGGILGLISGPGYKSATRNIIQAWKAQSTPVMAEDLAKLRSAALEDAGNCQAKTGRKGRRAWSDAILKDVENACGFEYRQNAGPARHCEFAVMLDHAARRVSIGHSWIKRAEAERRKFKTDAAKFNDVPACAKEWLDEFCVNRTGSSNALDAYRFRKRAVAGWKEVVVRWGRVTCKTTEDRVAAAREAQADPDIDKFGDIQLFEALAEDDALCVWQVNNAPTAQPLIDYAAAADANAKQVRFKVPAYRHPDPLAHPVFCDFGNSRWGISFALHAAATKLDGARGTLDRRQKDRDKSQERFAKATTPENQNKAQDQLKQAEKDLNEARGNLAWLSTPHAIKMGLWNGSTLDNGFPLRWSCKRLTEDMALPRNAVGTTAVLVTRADRLGRAATGASADAAIDILNVFREPHWNGRLQAPRAQLDAIAKHVAKYGWDKNAKQMRSRIRWLVSYSAKLQPAGPWINHTRTYSDGVPAKPFVSRKGEYAIQHKGNESRHGNAKIILSRLPGLRVLSVDLGHRYAAACAVWETLTSQQMNAECQAASRALPAVSDLFLHLATTDADGKKRTAIYRRIGADHIGAANRPHPAPWARLDRQFLIKLPGEEQPPRAASQNGGPDEIQQVANFAKRLGLVSDDESNHGRAVDEVMSRAVRIAVRGLKRHARHAKIAYAMDPNTKAIPGMGGGEKAFTRGDGAHVKFLTDALFDWHALASESGWDDKPARDLWNQHIAAMTNGWQVEAPKLPDEAAERPTRRQRSNDDEAQRERLKPIAEQLAAADCLAIHAAWKTRWEKDDGQPATVDKATGRKSADGSGLHADLRWLTDWIMGRHLPDATGDGWKRNVGGLSITRIATMKSLYQLQKAFAMRPRPHVPRGAPEKGETNAGVAQSILDALERMREQRVKQLASRIAEAALGIGRIKSKHVAAGKERPRAPVDNPCHAVVIENLTNYRPDELQTRRENRQLMDWSSSKVKKYLSEACQLHGLHLREVQAGYTSRQDSRTGAPGLRCADVPVKEFMTAPWWRKQVNAARRKKAEKNGGSAPDRYLLNLDERCGKIPREQWKNERPLRIPVAGGELFVSADPHSPAAKGLQADLNAAANVGLKALLDPDWPGKWWYVPCDSATRKPHAEKTRGSEAINPSAPLIEPAANAAAPSDPQRHGEEATSSKASRKEREIVNLWRDPTHLPIDGNGPPWRGHREYWNHVQCRVINVIENLRGTAEHAAPVGKAEKDIAPADVPW